MGIGACRSFDSARLLPAARIAYVQYSNTSQGSWIPYELRCRHGATMSVANSTPYNNHPPATCLWRAYVVSQLQRDVCIFLR